jgi:hypothetical protein
MTLCWYGAVDHHTVNPIPLTSPSIHPLIFKGDDNGYHDGWTRWLQLLAECALPICRLCCASSCWVAKALR